MQDQIMHEKPKNDKPYPFKHGSQCDQITQYLLSGKVLLNWEIREKFRCLSYTARINEIRRAGFDVRAEKLDGSTWRYWLPKTGTAK